MVLSGNMQCHNLEMAKAKPKPAFDAETVIQMTLNIFRDRVIGGKPMTDRDVQVLENSLRAYGKGLFARSRVTGTGQKCFRCFGDRTGACS